MFPVVITGQLASLSLGKPTDLHRGTVWFPILWEMFCMLKDEAGRGEEKVEEEEESIRFKILESLLQLTAGGGSLEKSGKNTISVFIKASMLAFM